MGGVEDVITHPLLTLFAFNSYVSLYSPGFTRKDLKKAFEILGLLARSEKPRGNGLTMVLDKGLGLYQANDLMEAAPYIDIIKLGWGTPRLFSEELIRKKIDLYKNNDIAVCNGGTFYEIACIQDKTDAFFDYAHEIGFNLIEISNGVISLSAEQKAEAIKCARDKGFTVISEVGKKEPLEDSKLSFQERIAEVRSDLFAGASHVIIEAREAGKSLGIYDDRGGVKEDLAQSLVREIGCDKIMFEAPEKNQQAYLVLHFGPDVNLGNIRPDDVIPLETLRRGIRGDTFGRL
jgi:phosphosulfolactate synthase